MKPYVWVSGLIAIFIIIAAIPFMNRPEPVVINEGDIVMYKSPTCGCCAVYADYLKRNDLSVKVVEVDDISPYMAGVPQNLMSCHNLKIGKYFVEGHIPIEAIQKLMAEQPDIAGIAMPGMPSGSPGMPGSKQGQWTIYAVHQDGSYDEFMTM